MIKTLFRIFLSTLPKFSITANLTMENLALRQQLAVMKRTCKRPQLQTKDRFFWILFSRLWCRWREVLVIVKPETVVRWHRQGLKIFWKNKYRHRGRVGRSRINKELRALVRRMTTANSLWGAPRIHGELLKLGVEISERTVSNLMPARPSKPPSQTWRAFLKNHMHINEVFTAPRSPWQNPYVERFIGSIRRDCLNHVIVLNQKHLKQILTSYFEYYHNDRTHCGLDKDTPIARPVQPKPANCAKVTELPRVGGLHHRYEWRQAA
jgi:putative transposase